MPRIDIRPIESTLETVIVADRKRATLRQVLKKFAIGTVAPALSSIILVLLVLWMLSGIRACGSVSYQPLGSNHTSHPFPNITLDGDGSIGSYRWYEPKSGHVLAIAPVPKRLIGSDGWVDTDLLQPAFYYAVDRSYGDVDPVETKALSTWKNRSTSGLDYTTWGGRFVTQACVPSGRMLDVLRTSPTVQFKATGSAYFVSVRYWYAKSDNMPKPGRLFATVELTEQLNVGTIAIGDAQTLAALSIPLLEALHDETNQ